MFKLKTLWFGFLLLLPLLGTAGLLGGAAYAAESVAELAPQMETEGSIEKLDFGANTMIFEGVRYQMAPDLVVEIRGGPGAFTMLREGMKAVVIYRVISATERHAVNIRQLPDKSPGRRLITLRRPAADRWPAHQSHLHPRLQRGPCGPVC